MKIYTSSADPASYSSTSFAIIQPTTGTSPTADAPDDTLTLTSSDGSMIITGNATTDTLDFSVASSFLAEAAQDAVGGILLDSSEIDFTYDDSTPSITATLKTTGVSAGSYGLSNAVPTLAIDSKGRITSASNTSINIITSQITDFALDVNDRIASLIQDGSGITWVYDRALSPLDSTLTPTVNLSPFTTTDLAEGTNLYFTDERAQDAIGAMVGASLIYVDGTPLLARAALTGDVTAAQDSNVTTLATVNSNVGSFGSATQVGGFTVNAKGLITAASNTTITPAVSSITGLGTGVSTWLATPSSANLAAAVTDETGTGALVFANTPTLVTPAIGAATGTSLVLTGALTSNALTAGRVPFAGTSGILQDDADMTFATDTLTVTNVVGSTEVRMGNGLVNNPSLAFDSDTDTGWYRAGANQLGLSAAGVQSALFEELAVSSGSAQGWRLRNVTATATIPTLVPNQSDTNTGVGWEGADELSLVAGGVQAAHFGSTFSWLANDVGINTSTPAETLDVNGNTIIRGTMVIDVGASASAARVGADTGTYAALQFNGANNTSKDFIFQTGGSSRFTIRVSGNETGSNAGANLNFIPFDDSGGGLSTILQLRRANGNIGFNTTSYGTSATAVLSIGPGTAPTTSPADVVQLWQQDTVAGQANLYARNENGKAEQLTGLRDRVSTQFDKTSSTTLGDVTGLSINVEASKQYAFRAVLFTSSGSSGGVKAAIAGTATATSIRYEGLTYNAAALSAQTRSTALGTAVGGVTAVTAALIIIEGLIVVNAAGTLTVQFAQNASNGTASSVLTGSYFQVIPIGD